MLWMFFRWASSALCCEPHSVGRDMLVGLLLARPNLAGTVDVSRHEGSALWQSGES